MPRISAKDCKVTIAVAFVLAALVAVKTLHISSHIVPNEIVSYTPSIDTSKWSEAMLRASRSRINNSTSHAVAPRVEPQRRRQLQVQGSSLATVRQISQDSFSGDEIIVDIFSTSLKELICLFCTYKFKGIFLYHKTELDRV